MTRSEKTLCIVYAIIAVVAARVGDKNFFGHGNTFEYVFSIIHAVARLIMFAKFVGAKKVDVSSVTITSLKKCLQKTIRESFET